jgi:putative oxidoreductase
MNFLTPYAAFIMRLAVGGVFLQHGWSRFQRGLPATAAYVHDVTGLPAATVWAVVLLTIETVGAVCVLLGMWTRFWAMLMAAVVVVTIIAVELPRGRNLEFEALLLAGAVTLVALGDGPLSIAVRFKRGD